MRGCSVVPQPSPVGILGDPVGSPQDSQLPDSGCRNPGIHAEVLSETWSKQYIVKILIVETHSTVGDIYTRIYICMYAI